MDFFAASQLLNIVPLEMSILRNDLAQIIVGNKEELSYLATLELQTVLPSYQKGD